MKERFLIIDDNSHDLEWMVDKLKDYFEIIATTSPKQALDIIQKETIDVVLCDYMMDDMDGITFFKEIEDLPIKKYLITGFRMDKDVQEFAKEAGVHKVMTKTLFEMENFDSDTNMERIKTLVKELDQLNELTAIAHLENTSVDYEMDSGECRGIFLKNNGEIGVQDGWFSVNSSMKIHKHANEREVFHVYEGDLTIVLQTLNGGIIKHTIKDKGTFEIPCNTPHIVSSENGCKLIAVTLPASVGYPIS